MNERDIFLAALEITDRDARRSYLDQACGDNAALRASVEALFISHEEAGSFLKTPLVQPAGSDSSSETAIEKPSAAMERTVHLSQEHQAVNSEHDESAEDDEIPLGFLSPSKKPDSLGRLGHYEVLEVLGKGAFGTVLRAFDEKLHRMVAIKVMSAELASTSPARRCTCRPSRLTATALISALICSALAVCCMRWSAADLRFEPPQRWPC